MGAKGDRASKAPQAERLYADGHSLAQIARLLDVSETTLRRWKGESGVPGEETDGWDAARAQRRGMAQRLRDLLDREVAALEESVAGTVDPRAIDGVSKLGALVTRMESSERAPAYDKPRVFLENLQWIASWLRNNDAEGLKVLAANFDAMTLAFKSELLDA